MTQRTDAYVRTQFGVLLIMVIAVILLISVGCGGGSPPGAPSAVDVVAGATTQTDCREVYHPAWTEARVVLINGRAVTVIVRHEAWTERICEE